MTIVNSEPDGFDESRREQLRGVPVIGPGLARAHDATTALRPDEDDSRARRVAKRTAQGAIIVGAAGVTAVAIL